MPLSFSGCGSPPFPCPPSRKAPLDHRHIRNGILERHRNLAALANRPRKRISLHCILIANRNRFYPNAATKDVASIINKNSASPFRRRVDWYLDLNPPLPPSELHSL